MDAAAEQMPRRLGVGLVVGAPSCRLIVVPYHAFDARHQLRIACGEVAEVGKCAQSEDRDGLRLPLYGAAHKLDGGREGAAFAPLSPVDALGAAAPARCRCADSPTFAHGDAFVIKLFEHGRDALRRAPRTLSAVGADYGHDLGAVVREQYAQRAQIVGRTVGVDYYVE